MLYPLRPTLPPTKAAPPLPRPERWRRRCGSFLFANLRKDLQHLDVYTLDPQGCKIIDDGFSLEPRVGGGILLHVHVADPTCYFNPDDDVFDCAVTNGTSYYPSGRRARQMLDARVAAEASLSGGTRRAVTVTYDFGPGNVLTRVECRMTVLRCDERFRLSYKDAGAALRAGHRVLRRACRLAAAIRQQQQADVLFGDMAHLSLSCPRVVKDNACDRVQLVRNGPHVVEVKKMVSVFAVATNGNMARLLGAGPAPPPVVPALLGGAGRTPYIHFTSPLRRASDCVVHFELKNILAHTPGAVLRSDRAERACPPPVFAEARARVLVASARRAQTLSRKLQRLNIRTRFVQYIHQRLHTDGARRVVLRFRCSRASALRVRLLVCLLDGHSVRFLYDVYPGPGQAVDPRQYRDTQEPRDGEDTQTVHVTRCTQTADRYGYGSLPQIDALFLVPKKNVPPKPTTTAT